MSRIGRKGILVPKGVRIEINGSRISVQGPHGKLERDLHPSVSVKVDGDQLLVERKDEERIARSMHGLTRTLLANMVQGVVTPFAKSLEITGIGYRAELKGDVLNILVGFAHEVDHPIPTGVSCKVEKQTLVHLASFDKELLGQTAAEIRGYRRCEPYKGKGIKYVGERIRRKEGKTGAA